MKLNEGRIKYILERSIEKSNSNIDLYNIMRNEFEIEINDSIVTITDEEGNEFNIAWMMAETDTIDSIPEELLSKDLGNSGYILAHKKALSLEDMERLITYSLIEAVNLIEFTEIDLVVMDVMDVIVPANVRVIISHLDLNYATILHTVNFMSPETTLADTVTGRYIVDGNGILEELLEYAELLIISGVHHSNDTYGNGGDFVETPSVREGISSQWVNRESYHHRKLNPKTEEPLLEEYLEEGYADEASVIWVDLEKIIEDYPDHNVKPDFEGDLTKAPLVRMRYNPNQKPHPTIKKVGNRYENDI